MDQKPAIFFVIGTINRVNFILRTDLFKKLKEKDFRIVIISPFGDKKEFIEEFGGRNVSFEAPCRMNRIADMWNNWRNLALQIDHPRLTLSREIHSQVVRRYQKGHSGIIWASKKIFFSFLKIILGRRYASAAFWDTSWIAKIFMSNKRCRNLFIKYKPRAVIMASAGAEALDIPFIVHCGIFSVPSIALDGNIDISEFRYHQIPRSMTVWAVFSEIQKQELREVQGVPESHITVVGAVRYDYYFNNFKAMPREEFFRKIGADPAKKLITYGAKVPRAYPHNDDIMEIVLSAIKRNEFNEPAQLFVRFDPGHDVKRYGDLLKEIIWEDASMSHRDHVANLLYYSDVVISIGSTFNIEACFVDTPSIWIGFDGFMKYKNYKDSYRFVYNLSLFKRFISYGGIFLAESPDDLVLKIKQYLVDPSLDREKRRTLTEKEYFKPDGHAGERATESVMRLMGR